MANPPFDPYGNPIPSDPGAKRVTESDGTTYPIRTNLKVTNITVTDDPTSDTTALEATAAADPTGLATWRETYDAMARDLGCTESWYTDMTGDTPLYATAAGNGTITVQSTKGGVFRLGTSATAGGHAEIQSGYEFTNITGRSVLFGNPTTQKWMFAVRASMVTLTTNTDFRMGAAANLSGAWCGLRIKSTGVMKFEKNTASANTTYQPVTDGFHDFAMTYDGTTLTAYVDGTAVGTTTDPGLTGGSSMHIEIYNNGAAADEKADVDKIYAAWE